MKAGGAASWKRVKYTTKNAYIYSGAQNAVKYTFTVRVADQKGRYVSACNKAGVSLTYQASWAKLYKRFVMNQSFRKEKHVLLNGDYIEGTSDTIRFSLCDVDRDGIPELIGYTGFHAMADALSKVYTIRNGKVKYMGYTTANRLYTNAARTMLFGSTGRFSTLSECYFYYQNGKIRAKEVVSYRLDILPDESISCDTAVRNQKLYREYLRCTRLAQINGMREPGYPLDGDTKNTIRNIKSMGWDRFVRMFGF